MRSRMACSSCIEASIRSAWSMVMSNARKRRCGDNQSQSDTAIATRPTTPLTRLNTSVPSMLNASGRKIRALWVERAQELQGLEDVAFASASRVVL
jgi:hypothetical protein